MDSENEKTKDQSPGEVKQEEVEMSPQNENEEVSPDQVALTEDSSKVTFIPASDTSQNGEAKVELPEASPQYSGMSKEELMQYVNDPFWIRVRWVMFVLFWLIWIGMLAGAIVIIIFAPKCAPPPTTEWYQESPIYEVYTKSFKDSNGDGKGDLKGIESKLGYLFDIGIKTLWLPSIFETTDNDPDAVQDLKKIDPSFGTMEDFKSLIAAMNNKDMKLILDFVPNHSSDNSSWFKKSVNKEKGFEDFYVWKGGPNAEPIPNNWRSKDEGGPAWKWSPARKQFYLHQLSTNKPDYNLDNKLVIEALEDALEFWLDLGVAGFRMTGVNYLYEDFSNFTAAGESDGSSEARVPCAGNIATDYACLNHTQTLNQPKNLNLLRRFRRVLEKHSNDTGVPRVLIVQTVDSGSAEDRAQYYGTEDDKIADLQYNTDFIQDVKTRDNLGATVEKTVCKWIDHMPKWSIFAWAFGNEEVSRVASRFPSAIVDALHMMSMILPGTPFTYYGDELGMSDYSEVGEHDMRMRSPMQWENTTYAGFTFSNVTPWYPVNPDYERVNAERQLESESSHLSVYRELIKIRTQQASVKFGETKVSALTNTTLAFTRSMKGSPAYAVVVNFDQEATTVDLGALKIVPKDARVILKSGNGEIKQKTVDTSGISLGGYEGLVLSFVAQNN